MQAVAARGSWQRITASSRDGHTRRVCTTFALLPDVGREASASELRWYTLRREEAITNPDICASSRGRAVRPASTASATCSATGSRLVQSHRLAKRGTTAHPAGARCAAVPGQACSRQRAGTRSLNLSRRGSSRPRHAPRTRLRVRDGPERCFARWWILGFTFRSYWQVQSEREREAPPPPASCGISAGGGLDLCMGSTPDAQMRWRHRGHPNLGRLHVFTSAITHLRSAAYSVIIIIIRARWCCVGPAGGGHDELDPGRARSTDPTVRDHRWIMEWRTSTSTWSGCEAPRSPSPS